MIATRFVEGRRSSFKNALFNLQPGQNIIISQAEGSFTLPEDITKEIVWIAGGIGITPFRSQTKFLLDNQEYSRKITLIYSNRTQADICFEDLWAKAIIHMPRFKLVQTLVDDIPMFWAGERGMVDEAMILRAINNTENKDFYISGPEPMVNSFIPKLETMGIDKNNIHKDSFPNYSEKLFKTN
jgi:ferredoxin-NADP reductase